MLRKHDVLFVADEVICGFGRTGNWWGRETFKLQPDMLTCAKALSAAYQPISAVLINEKMHQAMLAQSDKLGSFAHGYTYRGHPVATAVALEVLKIYEEMDIDRRARRLGRRMLEGLQEIRRSSAGRRRGGRGHDRRHRARARTRQTRAGYAPAGRAGKVVDRIRARARPRAARHRRPHRVRAAARHHRGRDRRNGVRASAARSMRCASGARWLDVSPRP